MSFWKNPATADLAAFQGHAQGYNLPKADLAAYRLFVVMKRFLLNDIPFCISY